MKKSSNANAKPKPGHYRFREINGKILLTNDVGTHLIVDRETFDKLSAGKLDKSDKMYAQLLEMNAIRETDITVEEVERLRNKNLFLFNGPQLLIVIPTLRCNQKCRYCHASAVGRGSSEYDMTPETAKRVVDTIFNVPGINISIEFQGGEPLMNWEIVKFITDYSIEQNLMHEKNLALTLVTNMALLTDEKMKYLIDRKVGLCTSLDGPEFLHNHNRGGGYSEVVKKLKKAGERYSPKFGGYKPGALTTITRESLKYPREIVDTYVELGLGSIHLRSLNPVGFATMQLKDIYYSPDEFLEFYEKALDYIIELNKNGTSMVERTAWLFLSKIFSDYDPDYMDLRSPCGAGIGQIAFNYNGDVYTCDEGRMIAMQGDNSFRMGNVFENSYDELIGSPIVKQTCLASILDGIPRCTDCAYKPYCGVCPVLNYVEKGSLYSITPQNRRHKIFEGILDMIFIRLQDEAARSVFMKWLEKGIGAA
ncbi:MAG TPA: His-Xaa-Ser system radical SAM maturase HxsB [bacterium]|nr:His-Xaa-Ser system radical SAM maturase HxsB [bacterium]